MARPLLLLVCGVVLQGASPALAQIGAPSRPGPSIPKSPATPADIANQRIKDARSKIVNQNQVRGATQKAGDRALEKVTESAVGMKGDFNFLALKPDELRQRLAARAPRLSAKELALLEALDSRVSVDFDKAPLSTIVEFLRQKTKQTITIDKDGLEEADVDYESPVTLKVKHATVREVLKKVLVERGMNYILKDNAIRIVTKEQALESMVVRHYPVGELVLYNIDPNWPIYTAILIRAIKTTINPGHWDGNTGASVTFFEPTVSLVVRGTAEVHFRIRGAYFGTGK